MSLFVQLAEKWDAESPASNYRVGFAEHIRKFARQGIDRVVLVETDARRADVLREEWRWFQDVEVRIVDVDQLGPDPRPRDFFKVGDSAPTWDREAIVRRFPRGAIEAFPIEPLSLERLLDQVGAGGDVALLSVDARRTPLRTLAESVLGRSDLRSVSVTIQELDRGEVADWCAALRAAGLRAAGRPWGAAGTSMAWVRTRSAKDVFSAVSARGRILAGQAIVHARDDWLRASRWRSLTANGQVVRGRLDRQDLVDDAFGDALEPVSLRVVERRLAEVSGSPQALLSPADLPEWRVEVTRDFDPWDLANECRSHHGIWPLSFSYPGSPLAINPEPARLVSVITPGLPYAFEDELEYLDAYRSAYLGITHRKAGWDCFRHVEILGAGAVPWMLDADDIPRYSMVHHPKTALVTLNRLLSAPGRPDAQTRAAFRTVFEQYLTSRAMAAYLLQASGLEGARRVLFVDERLPLHADYLSTMTLIGLKQLLGRDCHALHPVDYLYSDTSVDTRGLYGRGFGYSRVLEPDLRSESELGRPLDASDADAVVIGSVTRNVESARRLLAQVPPERTIWIHGEDLPPTPKEMHGYRAAGVRMFVRAIHTDR